MNKKEQELNDTFLAQLKERLQIGQEISYQQLSLDPRTYTSVHAVYIVCVPEDKPYLPWIWNVSERIAQLLEYRYSISRDGVILKDSSYPDNVTQHLATRIWGIGCSNNLRTRIL